MQIDNTLDKFFGSSCETQSIFNVSLEQVLLTIQKHIILYLNANEESCKDILPYWKNPTKMIIEEVLKDLHTVWFKFSIKNQYDEKLYLDVITEEQGLYNISLETPYSAVKLQKRISSVELDEAMSMLTSYFTEVATERGTKDLIKFSLKLEITIDRTETDLMYESKFYTAVSGNYKEIFEQHQKTNDYLEMFLYKI